MAFVSGPRQCGKTTLAKGLLKARAAGRYDTWDRIEVRRAWAKSPGSLLPSADPTRPDTTPLWVLDEIHKVRDWKRSLKGVFDTLSRPVDILVTGSARLNVYRRGGDSLMGRYLSLRLHPFSVREVCSRTAPGPDAALASLLQRGQRVRPSHRQALDAILEYGAFPQPFIEQDARLARIWRAGRVEQLIREDLRDLSRIRELSQVELLASLLPERVGSLLSVQSLSEDLEIAHRTAASWLQQLKDIYYAFEVKPFTSNIRRSIRKAGKLYLWDHTQVEAPGPRFENAIACHLRKACDFWTDTGEGAFDLRFLRSRDGHEIDFLIVRDGDPWLAIEAKLSDTTPSPHFRTFAGALGTAPALQLVRQSGHFEKRQMSWGEVTVASADEVLAQLV